MSELATPDGLSFDSSNKSDDEEEELANPPVMRLVLPDQANEDGPSSARSDSGSSDSSIDPEMVDRVGFGIEGYKAKPRPSGSHLPEWLDAARDKHR